MKSKSVDAGLAIAAGDGAPLGATVAAGGVNISVFSRNADRVEAEGGLRFDSDEVQLDLYGLAVAVPDSYARTAARRPGDNTAHALKSVVHDVFGAPR